jgi:hypothetical protein
MGQIQRGMEMVAGISDARLRCEGLMKVAARRLVEHNDPSVCEIILNGIRGGDYSNQDIEDYVEAFADFAEICARFERADAFELIISAAGGVPHAFGGVGSGCALARLYVVSSAFGLERSWVDLLFRIAECGGAQVREIARKLLAEGIPLKNVTDEVRLKAAGVLVTVSGELNPHSAGEILWFVLARADAPADLIKELEQKFPDLAIGAGLLLEALEFGDFPFEVLTSLTRASEKDSAIQRQMLVRILLDNGSFEDVFRIVKEESNLLSALVE